MNPRLSVGPLVLGTGDERGEPEAFLSSEQQTGIQARGTQLMKQKVPKCFSNNTRRVRLMELSLNKSNVVAVNCCSKPSHASGTTDSHCAENFKGQKHPTPTAHILCKYTHVHTALHNVRVQH